MDSRASSRASRRSYPNLHNLSLAPLTTTPLDASQPPSPSEALITTPHTSYIVQKSAPTTPGILSLSQSRSSSRNGRRHSKNPAYAYDSYFVNPDAPVRDVGEIPKAKSTTALLPGVKFAVEPRERHHKRKSTAPIPLRLPLVRHHTSEANDEWLHRAGLAIAGETRESKGQSWLVRRDSSTSLVQQTDDYEQHPSHDGRHMALLSGEHLNHLDFDTLSPRLSRSGSRVQSRVGSRVVSARTSRRGSRVGSKVDLMMSTVSKNSSTRHSLEMDENMFADNFAEPDFVDDDESDGDEEEVARLARERGFGLGSWMDRLIGWTLFSVDEDGESSGEEEEDEDEDDNGDEAAKPENMTKEELKLRREVDAKRRKLERETIIAASAVHPHDAREINEDEESNSSSQPPPPPPNEESGGWQDAAWLFSVASKVIL